MDIRELATQFTEMLQAGNDAEAAAQFNAPDIVSIEPMEGPMARIEGTEAVKQKSEWWYANHDVHAFSAAGPFVNGDQFALQFSIDVTSKETGERVQMDEIGLYTVRDGKIVEERFLY